MSNLIFVLTAFAVVSCIALSESHNRKCNTRLYIFLSVLLVIFVGIRDGSSLNDYNNYIRIYNDLSRRSEMEFSYNAICDVAKYLGGVSLVFFMYAVLGMTTKLIAFERLTKLPFLTLTVYIANIMILHDMTQIRAGVASGIFLLSLQYLFEGRKMRYVMMIALAFCFHYSSLLFLLPCLYWNKHLRDGVWFYVTIIPIGYLLGSTIINPEMIPYEPLRVKIVMYRELQQSGVNGFTDLNVFNPYIVFRIALYYLLLYKSNLIEPHNKFFKLFLFIDGLAICIFPALSSIAILGYRGSELLGVVEILLYPMLYYAIKPKLYAKLSVISIAAVLLLINLTYKHLIYF
ncbi:EpsG family protein [Paramuribaculum intestinale]|uniref:EpsG family protein n=2 Tax=Paramuribaculum intestinale TaxID=2094151 RepID=UPI000F46C99A|nr:EpsG family protein [Paramuribaculum intestinale]ROT16373.1 EpsG family protein [Muribaculaceae bacterium Isolate-105 (HZI)]